MPVSHFYLRRLPSQEQALGASDAESYSDCLFPLVSINLRKINPLWPGWISCIYSFEDPYFEPAAQYENDLCRRDEKLSFRLIDGRQQFAGEPGFFSTSDDWEEHVAATKTNWLKARTEHCSAPVALGGKPKWVQNDQTPLDTDGKKMTFIAHVSSHHYLDASAEKDFFLFYSPAHQLVTQVVQVT